VYRNRERRGKKTEIIGNMLHYCKCRGGSLEEGSGEQEIQTPFQNT